MTIDKQPILPNAVYTVAESASLLGVDKRQVYGAIKRGEMNARHLGNGYKIVGDNLLRFAGSATYSSQTSSSNTDTSG